MPAKKDIDPEQVLDLVEKGYTKQQIAEQLGVSVPTLSKRIGELRQKQGVLLEYRAVQTLHLTELQARILEAITPAKIDGAPLKDLCLAYKVLASHEGELDLDSGKIKGLLQYLIQLERDDMEKKTELARQTFDTEAIEVVPDDEKLPRLS